MREKTTRTFSCFGNAGRQEGCGGLKRDCRRRRDAGRRRGVRGKTAVRAVHRRRRFEAPAARGAAGARLPIRYFRRHGPEARRTGSHSSMRDTGPRGIRGEGGAGGRGRSFRPGRMPGMLQRSCLRRSARRPSRAGMAASGSGRMAMPGAANPVRPEPCNAPSAQGYEIGEVGAQGPAWPGGGMPRRPARTAPPARSPPPLYTYMAPLRPRFDEPDKTRAAARRQRPCRAAKGRCGAPGGKAVAEVRHAV